MGERELSEAEVKTLREMVDNFENKACRKIGQPSARLLSVKIVRDYLQKRGLCCEKESDYLEYIKALTRKQKLPELQEIDSVCGGAQVQLSEG